MHGQSTFNSYKCANRFTSTQRQSAEYRLDTKAYGCMGFRSPSEAYIKPTREARGFYVALRRLINPVDP